jgi:transcriptional antiterminator RfaH
MYPADLLSGFACQEEDRHWWVIHTKVRQEKAFARNLVQFEVPFYLPLVAKENLIRGRRVSSYIPLFSGYVFVYGSEHERISCLTTNRIANVLPVRDGDKLRQELEQVERLIESDAPLTVERWIQPGQRVRIKAGSMVGIEGTVVSRRRRSRLFVEVSLLQQGVSLELDDVLLEPIG